MKRLMEKLGNPEKHLRIIHIAGTNGKGSVSRYIYEALEEAGYNAGIFTSPFIERFNERIEVNHNTISGVTLERLTDKVMKAVSLLKSELDEEGSLEKGDSSVTEFDIITAVGFLYFSETKADPVVLEVGLGGRGDSTNVINNPMATVITTIGLDHCDRLGNTMEEIASEKAGIIKPGCPVISAVTDEAAKAVIKARAEELSCEFKDVSGINTGILAESLAGTEFTAEGEEGIFNIKMPGVHQVTNAVTAIETIKLLKEQGKVAIPEEALKSGLYKAFQPGRTEVIPNENGFIILDGAHNPQGAKALRLSCSRLLRGRKILMVTAMMKDKDAYGILRELEAVTKDFIATDTGDARCMSPDELGNIIESGGGRCTLCPGAGNAVNKALEAAGFDVIIFAGSLYLIGEVRGYLREKGILEE